MFRFIVLIPFPMVATLAMLLVIWFAFGINGVVIVSLLAALLAFAG